MKILVFTKLDATQKSRLQTVITTENDFLFKDELSEDQLLKALQEVEIILGNIPIKYIKANFSGLKFWQLDSAGFDQYQHTNFNIIVANMGTFYAQRCAESIVTGLFSFYRGIHTLTRLQTQKKWIGAKIRQDLQAISGKKVIILGAGAIALAAQKMLLGFGCSVKLTARKNPIADIHSIEDLLNMLPETDAVVNTLPGSAANYVNQTFIDTMKTGSVYANVGRGNTTDENALIAALESNKLAGAVLDVTTTEPLPANNKLWEMEQVILTQHSAGGDQYEIEGKVLHFIKNVNRFQQGEQPEDLIDLKRGY